MGLLAQTCQTLATAPGGYGPPSVTRLTVSVSGNNNNEHFLSTDYVFALYNECILFRPLHKSRRFHVLNEETDSRRFSNYITQTVGELSGVQTQTFLLPKPKPKGSCDINCRWSVPGIPMKNYFKVITCLFSNYFLMPTLGWAIGSWTKETWPCLSHGGGEKNQISTQINIKWQTVLCAMMERHRKMGEAITRGPNLI